MKANILYVCSICLLLGVGGCTEDRFSEIPSTPEPVKPGQGQLVLKVAPVLPPAPKETRGPGMGNSGLSASFPGMDVELVNETGTNTRSSVHEDSHMHNLTIIQFEGTLPTSKSKKFWYKVADENLNFNLDDVIFDSSSSSSSRIVVIANTKKGFFAPGPWGNGERDYAYLMNQFYLDKFANPNEGSYSPNYPYFRNPDDDGDHTIMIGQTDVKVEADKQVVVVMSRILAKAQFNIEISQKLKDKYNIWQAQLSSVPGKCYISSIGRGTPFPNPELLGESGYFAESAVSATNGVFNPEDLKYTLPINLQPTVSTATTATRTLLAPKGSTYLQITGINMTSTGFVRGTVIYQIYLGSNFTDNFSIMPNIGYTYNINIKGESTEDGSVVKFIPGYWGGKLQAYDANGNIVSIDAPNAQTWRFEKKIEAYLRDVPRRNDAGMPGTTQMPWFINAPHNNFTNSMTDGKDNTWKIQGGAGTPPWAAAYGCWYLNDYDNTTGRPTDKEQYGWYLPAISQLLGIYLVSENQTAVLSDTYWSSTTKVGEIEKAFYISKDGEVGRAGLKDLKAVRAVRDITD